MNSNQIETLVALHPIVDDLIQLKETIWLNPQTTSLAQGLPYVGLTQQDIDDARNRLARFAPYLMSVFPETEISKGMIESELVAIPKMQQALETQFKQDITGKLWLKKTVICQSQDRSKRVAVFTRCSIRLKNLPFKQGY